MSCYFMFFKGKYRHTRRKMVGLIRQLFRCHRRFFYQRGVLLSHLIHLADSLCNLLNPPLLFFRRRGNFSHNVVHAGHRTDNIDHGRGGVIHQFRTLLDTID